MSINTDSGEAIMATDQSADPKPRGRPPLPPDQRKAERLELRTTAVRLAKLQRLAQSAGVSANAWLEQRIDAARE